MKSFTFVSLALAATPALAQAVDELVGFGEGTTGGGDATPVTVTSCDDLSDAVGADGAAVVQIDGQLSDCGVIDVASDKTILGVGSSSGMTGGGFRIKEANNVIIRNLELGPPSESDDVIALQVATQVWIDHNTLHSVGLTGDKDTYDGLLDITHASDFVTVSWNVFADHWKASLVGHSDSNADEDTGHLRVTYHHNLWSNINSRTPSLRFGTGHIFNSIFQDVPTSGINSRMGGQVLVENNIFSNVTLAIVTDLDSDIDGLATDLNNVFTDSTEEITEEATWTPDYDYTLDSTDDLESIVTSGAGVGILTF